MLHQGPRGMAVAAVDQGTGVQKIFLCYYVKENVGGGNEVWFVSIA